MTGNALAHILRANFVSLRSLRDSFQASIILLYP
jgi:hypothetical protein